MTPKKFITLLLLFSSSVCFAHEDFWTTRTFENVKVRVSTGFFGYEEINKCWIIGELASKLAKSLKYSDTIFLDFTHHYTSYCLPDYFVSYDDGSINQTWVGAEPINFLKSKALVIREVSRQFNVLNTLKLVEYAILNKASIREKQRPLEYNKNYCQWLINTIDTSKTRQITLSTSSNIVTDILKNKISRHKKEFYDVSYYFQNNKYYVCCNNYRTNDTALLVLDNIYQFSTTLFNEAIVFDTDSTFYYVKGVNYPHASKRWTIFNKEGFYEPYNVVKVGSNKMTISLNYSWSKQDRTLLYRSDKDDLTQDLDKILDR